MIRRLDPIIGLLVAAIVVLHLVAPVLHGMGEDFAIGVLSGFLLGLVVGLVADRLVLVPTVDAFERRDGRG